MKNFVEFFKAYFVCFWVQGHLDAIDVEKAVEFIASCMNFDGGFGSKPGSESHAGLIYCCLGLLSITGEYCRFSISRWYRDWYTGQSRELYAKR